MVKPDSNLRHHSRWSNQFIHHTDSVVSMSQLLHGVHQSKNKRELNLRQLHEPHFDHLSEGIEVQTAVHEVHVQFIYQAH